MKLSEVTPEVAEDFQQFSSEPVPNICTWIQLALQFNKHIVKDFRTECCTWEKPMNKLTMFTRSNESVQFSIQIRRFAFYMYYLECDPFVLQYCYEASCKLPKRFIHSSCETKMCLNYDHLLESYTAYDPNHTPNILKGSECHSSKLTEHQVREIHASFLPLRELAHKYNVSQTTVHLIQTGGTWSHLGLKPRPLKYHTKH